MNLTCIGINKVENLIQRSIVEQISIYGL